MTLDGILDEVWNKMDDLDRYDAAIREIAEKAPVRIIPGMKLVGSASLGNSIGHDVPAVRRGKTVFRSISHVTLGFARALKTGINAMEAEIDEKMNDPTLTERQLRFELGLKNTIASMRIWHRRYLTYDDLYSALLSRFDGHAVSFINGTNNGRLRRNDDGEWIWKESEPCPVASLFTENCIDKGYSYTEGGPVYTVVSPHIGGAPDTADSLYAIKKLVYEEKRITLTELLDILESNWNGAEELRMYVKERYVYYVNDNPEADSFMADLLNDYTDIVKRHDNGSPIRYPSGISTFVRQI